MKPNWWKKQLKQRNQVKLGPGFFVNGDDKMLFMTRPIDAFLYGYDQLVAGLKPHLSTMQNDSLLPHLFASTLDNLTSDLLNYFQNRVRAASGKEEIIKDVKRAKDQLMKVGFDLKAASGEVGYDMLRALDLQRGDSHHKNDRYFHECKVDERTITSVAGLLSYAETIKDIVVRTDAGLEKQQPSYEMTRTDKPGQVTLALKALGHSFDATRMKVNKKPRIEDADEQKASGS